MLKWERLYITVLSHGLVLIKLHILQVNLAPNFDVSVQIVISMRDTISSFSH